MPGSRAKSASAASTSRNVTGAPSGSFDAFLAAPASMEETLQQAQAATAAGPISRAASMMAVTHTSTHAGAGAGAGTSTSRHNRSVLSSEAQLKRSRSAGEAAASSPSSIELVSDGGPGGAADTEAESAQGASAGFYATGLHNLGNTCYMNAVLQALCACARFRELSLGLRLYQYHHPAPPHQPDASPPAMVTLEGVVQPCAGSPPAVPPGARLRVVSAPSPSSSSSASSSSGGAGQGTLLEGPAPVMEAPRVPSGPGAGGQAGPPCASRVTSRVTLTLGRDMHPGLHTPGEEEVQRWMLEAPTLLFARTRGRAAGLGAAGAPSAKKKKAAGAGTKAASSSSPSPSASPSPSRARSTPAKNKGKGKGSGRKRARAASEGTASITSAAGSLPSARLFVAKRMAGSLAGVGAGGLAQALDRAVRRMKQQQGGGEAAVVAGKKRARSASSTGNERKPAMDVAATPPRASTARRASTGGQRPGQHASLSLTSPAASVTTRSGRTPKPNFRFAGACDSPDTPLAAAAAAGAAAGDGGGMGSAASRVTSRVRGSTARPASSVDSSAGFVPSTRRVRGEMVVEAGVKQQGLGRREEEEAEGALRTHAQQLRLLWTLLQAKRQAKEQEDSVVELDASDSFPVPSAAQHTSLAAHVSAHAKASPPAPTRTRTTARGPVNSSVALEDEVQLVEPVLPAGGMRPHGAQLGQAQAQGEGVGAGGAGEGGEDSWAQQATWRACSLTVQLHALVRLLSTAQFPAFQPKGMVYAVKTGGVCWPSPAPASASAPTHPTALQSGRGRGGRAPSAAATAAAAVALPLHAQLREQFNNGSQQDAQEFTVAFLDALHEEYRTGGVPDQVIRSFIRQQWLALTGSTAAADSIVTVPPAPSGVSGRPAQRGAGLKGGRPSLPLSLPLSLPAGGGGKRGRGRPPGRSSTVDLLGDDDDDEDTVAHVDAGARGASAGTAGVVGRGGRRVSARLTLTSDSRALAAQYGTDYHAQKQALLYMPLLEEPARAPSRVGGAGRARGRGRGRGAASAPRLMAGNDAGRSGQEGEAEEEEGDVIMVSQQPQQPPRGRGRGRPRGSGRGRGRPPKVVVQEVSSVEDDGDEAKGEEKGDELFVPPVTYVAPPALKKHAALYAPVPDPPLRSGFRPAPTASSTPATAAGRARAGGGGKGTVGSMEHFLAQDSAAAAAVAAAAAHSSLPSLLSPPDPPPASASSRHSHHPHQQPQRPRERAVEEEEEDGVEEVVPATGRDGGLGQGKGAISAAPAPAGRGRRKAAPAAAAGSSMDVVEVVPEGAEAGQGVHSQLSTTTTITTSAALPMPLPRPMPASTATTEPVSAAASSTATATATTTLSAVLPSASTLLSSLPLPRFQPSNAVWQMFTGSTVSTIACAGECATRRNRVENYSVLSLDLLDQARIEALLSLSSSVAEAEATMKVEKARVAKEARAAAAAAKAAATAAARAAAAAAAAPVTPAGKGSSRSSSSSKKKQGKAVPSVAGRSAAPRARGGVSTPHPTPRAGSGIGAGGPRPRSTPRSSAVSPSPAPAAPVPVPGSLPTRRSSSSRVPGTGTEAGSTSTAPTPRNRSIPPAQAQGQGLASGRPTRSGGLKGGAPPRKRAKHMAAPAAPHVEPGELPGGVVPVPPVPTPSQAAAGRDPLHEVEEEEEEPAAGGPAARLSALVSQAIPVLSSLQQPTTLQLCLSRLTRAQDMEGESAYDCDECSGKAGKGKQSAVMRCLLHALPPVLVIHLNRAQVPALTTLAPLLARAGVPAAALASAATASASTPTTSTTTTAAPASGGSRRGAGGGKGKLHLHCAFPLELTGAMLAPHVSQEGVEALQAELAAAGTGGGAGAGSSSSSAGTGAGTGVGGLGLQGVRYMLRGLVEHTGQGMDSGHYTACIAAYASPAAASSSSGLSATASSAAAVQPDHGTTSGDPGGPKGGPTFPPQQWLHVDDSKVRPISVEEVQAKCAYMLFYERVQ